MKKILTLSAFSAAMAIFMAACGGETNTNVNVSRGANANGSSMGNAMNSAANNMANSANSTANSNSSAMSSSPDAFLKEAAEGGMAEVELGKLAAKNAVNAEVKKFAQMMITDHTKAYAELKALAAKKNITLPTDAGSHKSDIEEIGKMKGADFDKDYVDAMVEDHEADVAAFEKQANSSSDPDVKAFAAKCLPVLKKHLETIKGIQAKMNK